MFNTATATQRKGEFYQGVCLTDWDVSNGKPQSSEECPICLALEKYGMENPSVGYDKVLVEVDGDEYIASMPDGAIQFLQKFDAGIEVKPINFVLHFKEYTP